MVGAGLLAGIAIVLAIGVAGTNSNGQAGPSATAVHQDTAGKGIFLGKGNCAGCHGPDAKGTALAPNLTDGEWLHIDGSLESIVTLVKAGVPKPKKVSGPMPPKGGAQLSDDEVTAVSRYVFSLSTK
jgi:mono/diheme cytochrome c family protein